MKNALNIARLELSTLFFSPIAWFLLIVFLFQCGITYTGTLENFLIMQGMGGDNLSYLNDLTEKVFAPPFGIFPAIAGKIYLYLPLLTMGLMSREISSGTIKLLYSSPIKVREIVYGKFFAMMIYCLALAICLSIPVFAGMSNIKLADTGLMFAGVFGLYLLLCAYSAIGLFMSCLTSYQVVAAVSTLVMLAVLNYIGTLWQDIDFVRDLTWFLSISGRTSRMTEGAISSKDVIYFIVIIYLFLALSIYKLQSGRESSSWLYKTGRYSLIIVLALVAGYFSSRPGFIAYLDTTVTLRNTMTPVSQQIVKEMKDGPLEVDSYINLMDQRYWSGQPSQRNADVTRWEQYVRYKHDIHFKYIYYYSVPYPNPELFLKSYPGLSMKQIAEQYAKSFKTDANRYVSGESLAGAVNLTAEENRYVMHLTYNGHSTFLRLFDDPGVFPSEAETGAALKRMMVHAPKVAFLKGHLERDQAKLGDKSYGYLSTRISYRYSLVNQGFDVDSIELKDKDVPDDVTTLVIADPRADIDAVTLAKIKAYIDRGGNLLIAGEPGKQSVLNPLLQTLGVQMMDGMVVQPSADYAPDLVLPHMTKTAASFSSSLADIFGDSIGISMPNVAALSYMNGGPFTVQPLLLTDPRSCWNKKMPLNADSPTVTYAPAEGDERKVLSTALALSRTVKGKEQRIVVTGDADFLSNAELGRGAPRNANFYFNTAVFGWLSNGEFPIDTSRPKNKDNRLRLSNAGMTLLKTIILGVLPGLLLVLGTVLLIRRKRK